MFRSLKFYISLIASMIFNKPKHTKLEKNKASLSTEEYIDLVYNITSSWAGRRIKSSGAKIIVHNPENLPEGTVLFVSNHQSNFDIPILMSYLKKPKGFVAKIELEKIPFLSDWMKSMNCLFMDRDDLKQSVQIIIEGIKLLKSGYSMVIFPEGTRSKGDTLGEFKQGSFKLAIKSKVPIVPITLDGSYKIMEANGFKIKPAEVHLYIHKPICTDKLTKDELAVIQDTVRDIIEKPIKNK